MVAKTHGARSHKNKIRNPNIEIRNKPKDLNPNYKMRNRLVWSFLFFDQLKLFRISDFELRICDLVYAWRALRSFGFAQDRLSRESSFFPVP